MFSVDMGIDLGTANTVVCVRDKGVILSEPSVVAVKKGTNEVLLNGEAVGTEVLADQVALADLVASKS